MASFRGGGAGFDDGRELPMTPQPHQYEPNTVQWAGKGTSFAPIPSNATNKMPEVPSAATIGNPVMSNPIVSTFPPARGRG